MLRGSPQFVITRLVGKLAIVHVFGEIDHRESWKLEDAIRDAARDPGVPVALKFVDCEAASASVVSVLRGQYALLADRLRIVAPPKSAFGLALAALPGGTLPARFDEVRDAIRADADFRMRPISALRSSKRD